MYHFNVPCAVGEASEVLHYSPACPFCQQNGEFLLLSFSAKRICIWCRFPIIDNNNNRMISIFKNITFDTMGQIVGSGSNSSASIG